MSHAVKIVDDDKHFLIDSFTRQVSSEYSKLMITNGDHNSERFMPILTASNGKRYELIAADDGTLQLSQVK